MTLKQLRKNAGLTQKELAKLVGYEQTIISLWENGLRDPNVQTLIDLSRILNCSVDKLVGLEEEQEETQKKEPEKVEPREFQTYKSEFHKECIDLVNQLTETQALKLSGYIEKIIEDSKQKNKKNID